MTLQGRVVVQPLVGQDRDEITALVSRIRDADARARMPLVAAPKPVAKEDADWAADWKLPSEVFDYFELDRQSPREGGR
jgi:hypothetical protein